MQSLNKYQKHETYSSEPSVKKEEEQDLDALFENGNITILEETITDDWYAKGIIFHKTIIFVDNDTGECYCVKQIIQRSRIPINPRPTRFGIAATISEKENKNITLYGEEVFIEKPNSYMNPQPKKKKMFTGDAKVKCRNCNGDHWTHECTEAPKAVASSSSESSHYVAPSMRKDAESKRVTVKISNIPEDIDRDILKEMFNCCGRIYRCNVPVDKRTGQGRGFAFIDFYDQEGAKTAVITMNGKPIDYNIISVEFALDKEGNKQNISINETDIDSAKKRVVEAKEREAKRADVYEAPRRERPPHEDRPPRERPERRERPIREEHEKPKAAPGFSRGSALGSRGTSSPRTNIHTSTRSTETNSTGWQPRVREQNSQTRTLGSQSRTTGFSRGSAKSTTRTSNKLTKSPKSNGGWRKV